MTAHMHQVPNAKAMACQPTRSPEHQLRASSVSASVPKREIFDGRGRRRLGMRLGLASLVRGNILRQPLLRLLAAPMHGLQENVDAVPHRKIDVAMRHLTKVAEDRPRSANVSKHRQRSAKVSQGGRSGEIAHLPKGVEDRLRLAALDVVEEGGEDPPCLLQLGRRDGEGLGAGCRGAGGQRR